LKVLLIGNGGREHALPGNCGFAAGDGALCHAGNPGTPQFAENVAIDPLKFSRCREIRSSEQDRLVGDRPEDPLAAGLATMFRRWASRCRPRQGGARIEATNGSPRIDAPSGDPHCDARMFTDAKQAEEYIHVKDEPLVIRRPALAKGEGCQCLLSNGRRACPPSIDHAAEGAREAGAAHRYRRIAHRAGMLDPSIR